MGVGLVEGPTSSTQRLGEYVLFERLAAGGMGEVFLAHRRGLAGFEKLLVVKRILPGLADDAEFVKMFLNEARLAATLEHPNIVRLYDLGRQDGVYFIAMEYLHGVPLARLMVASARDQPLDEAACVAIALGISRGLHYAHQKKGLDGQPLGIVHRDVSPGNVFITYDGEVKVLDFGVARALHVSARITQGDAIKGKVGYMSPEQVRDDDVDARSDVFGIGILMYELLTRRRMFRGDNQFVIMNRVASGTFVPSTEVAPELPPELHAILRRALATERDERYPSALALVRDLEGYAQARRLNLSPMHLAAGLEARCGRPDYPVLERQTEPAIAGRGASVPGDRPRRARWRWVIGATVIVAMASAALVVADWRSGAERIDPPRVLAETPERPASPAPPAEAAEEPSPDAAPATADPQLDTPPAGSPTSTSAEAPRRSRGRRAKRSATKAKPRERPLRGLDGMLPAK